MPITTCTYCGGPYEAGSEEQANEPVRLCITCKPQKQPPVKCQNRPVSPESDRKVTDMTPPDLDNAIRATAKAHARPILGWDVQRWCEAQGKRVPPMDDVIAAIKRMFAQGELVYDAGRGFALARTSKEARHGC